MLRARREGWPTVRARVVASLIVLGMVAITAPILAAPLLASLHWLLSLL
jgi:preprotein translocase subunit SecE